MSPPTTNADIMREIGVLSADMRHGQESRKVIHEKLDRAVAVQLETTSKLSDIDHKVEMVTSVASQARDYAVDALKNIHRFETEFREKQLPLIAAAERFKVEAEPVLGTIKAVRNIVLGFLGLGIFSVGTVAVMAVYAREQLGMFLRYVLGLS